MGTSAPIKRTTNEPKRRGNPYIIPAPDLPEKPAIPPVREPVLVPA